MLDLRRACVLIFVVLGAVPRGAAAADVMPRVASLPADLGEDLRHLPSRETAWWLLGGGAAALIVAQFEDPESMAARLNQPVIDELADFGNIWGDVRLQAPLALGTWGVGALAGSPDAAGLGYDLTRSLGLTYATVSLLKLAFDRTRPNGDGYSFPSGHTASAFSTAGVVSGRYGGWAGGAAIGLGVLAGLGRMEDLRHYPSDVIFGATIGWVIGRTVARPDARPDDGVGLGLQLVPAGRGLALVGRF
jgi:membrane-associated phospholipid phosphatase